MREQVAMTARVHKRRRAGPRPPKSKKGGNLRGRIDGMRESLTHRANQGDIAWTVLIPPEQPF